MLVILSIFDQQLTLAVELSSKIILTGHARITLAFPSHDVAPRQRDIVGHTAVHGAAGSGHRSQGLAIGAVVDERLARRYGAGSPIDAAFEAIVIIRHTLQNSRREQFNEVSERNRCCFWW